MIPDFGGDTLFADMYAAYDGLMDEVSIWDRVLTSSEIATLYSGIEVDNLSDLSNLIAYYDFEQDPTDSEPSLINQAIS